MINKIKNYMLVLATGLVLAVPALTPAIVSAAACDSNTASGIATGAGGSTGDTFTCGEATGVDDNSITNTAENFVNVFSIIVGIAAVIMIVYGGFRYITSGGDSGRVGNAKNTLIYAIVGLVIVALAQIIVKFVLHQANNVGS